MQLRLFAPFLPFVTEETWSWTHGSSIHRSPWPTAGELAIDGDRQLLADVASVLIMIRGAKSNAKVSMKTPVRKAVFLGDHAALERLEAIEADLRAVGHITGEVVWKIAEGPLTVEAELEEPPAA